MQAVPGVSDPLFNADEVAVLRAWLDQASALGQEAARVISDFHTALLDDGMEPEDAAFLTLNFQQNILDRGLGARVIE